MNFQSCDGTLGWCWSFKMVLIRNCGAALEYYEKISTDEMVPMVVIIASCSPAMTAMGLSTHGP